jgi:hypothetical protein
MHQVSEDRHAPYAHDRHRPDCGVFGLLAMLVANSAATGALGTGYEDRGYFRPLWGLLYPRYPRTASGLALQGREIKLMSRCPMPTEQAVELATSIAGGAR